MAFLIISGDHEIGSILQLSYYNSSGEQEELTSNINWYGSDSFEALLNWDSVSDDPSIIEILKFKGNQKVQLLSPIPAYILAIYNDVRSDIFAINFVSQTLEVNTLPIVGSGISLVTPVSSVSGLSTTTDNIMRINQSYRLILSTIKGEYPMLPRFGSNLYKTAMFHSIALQTDLENIKQDLLTDLSEQEPRATINKLDVTFDYINTISIKITYTIKNTNISGKLIYDYSVGGDVA